MSITDRQEARAQAALVEHEAQRLYAKYRGTACARACERSRAWGDHYDRVADRIVQIEREEAEAQHG